MGNETPISGERLPAAGAQDVAEAVPAPAAPPPRAAKARNLRKAILALSAACAATLALALFLYAGAVSTDDAQVDAHVTYVSPRISGYVRRILVSDNQRVEKGDLLVEIDPRDYQAAVDQAQASYAAAEAEAESARLGIRLTRDTTASSTQSFTEGVNASRADLSRSRESLAEAATAGLEAAKANVAARQATDARAQADLARYRPLLKTGDVSRQQFDAVEEAARVAASELNLARQQLAEAQEAVAIATADAVSASARFKRSQAQLRLSRAQQEQVPVSEARYQSALAAVKNARAKLDEARLQLSYTAIRAPISGQVTALTAQVGDYVSPGQQLFTIVPLAQVYVTANFKETQLARVRPGQRAVVCADMYPDVTFEGVVDSIAAATGSEQALLPPQNATGNFVKVVQRIPVKILVKRTPSAQAILRPGMNVKAKIYVR